MSGLLVLAGGGEFTEGCDFDDEVVAAAGSPAEVLLLTTASAYENPGKVLARAEGWLGAKGATVVDGGVLTRTDGITPEAIERVRSARAIYLSGGSPMHLRMVLKDSPLFDALLAAWRAGAVLAGSGAGADVLCDPMVDPRGGAFTVGLGVLPRMAVIPRFDEWSPEKVHRTVSLAPADVTLVGLPTRTAVVRDPDGRWRAEGVSTDAVAIYRGGEVTDFGALAGLGA